MYICRRNNWPFCSEARRQLNGHLLGLDKHWDLSMPIINKYCKPVSYYVPTPRTLENFDHILNIFLHDIGGCHINLEVTSPCKLYLIIVSSTLTLVIHMIKGTLKASEIAKCSFDIPMIPAFAPTMIIMHDGAPEVNPYRVVFRYRSCPARSLWFLSGDDLKKE